MNQVQPTRHDDGPQSRGGKARAQVSIPQTEYDTLKAEAAEHGLTTVAYIRGLVQLGKGLLATMQDMSERIGYDVEKATREALSNPPVIRRGDTLLSSFGPRTTGSTRLRPDEDDSDQSDAGSVASVSEKAG